MLPRIFVLVQKSVAMLRVKDPNPFRVVRVIADADLVGCDLSEVVLELDTNAVGIFEWDLLHGLAWKCGKVKLASGQLVDAGWGLFDNDHLRLLMCQKLSDHIVAWSLEEVGRACSPTKEGKR